MNMKISNLDLSQMEDFVNFNQKIYPERKDVKRRFLWQFLDNPLLENKDKPNVLLCYSNEEKIIGQFLLIPFEWYFRGKTYKGYCGVDYYVLEDYRGISGALLARRAIQGHKPYFVIGPSEIAKQITLSLGAKIIGKMNVFFWFRNPLSPILIAINLVFKNTSSLIHRKTKYSRFPSTLSSNSFEFKLVKELDNWNEYHWDNTVEFSRSLEFLKWRFFNNFEKYHFYLTNDSPKPIYFVARKCFLRGLILLVVVDYRIPYRDTNSWKSILRASKLLAKITSCDGVIIMSSHQFFDKELKKNWFIKHGKGTLIMTNAKIDIPNKVIQDRNLVYATMADSDVDMCFGE